MTCYRPLKGFRTADGVSFAERRGNDFLGDIELPCGQCIGCRMRRASDWSMRVMHEASLHSDNCFVTLTYGRDCVPANGSLDHRDVQLFLKRVRDQRKTAVRFYMCGEYGPLNGRPHYHACLFGTDFRKDRKAAGKSASGAMFFQSDELDKFWKLGRCSVQDLTPETASYCARYIMKKLLGPEAKRAYDYVDEETGEILQRKAEYAAMSLKPGIGSGWFEKYALTDAFAHDFVVDQGVRRPVPKYYDKLFRRTKNVKMDAIEFERQRKAERVRDDNTDERRRVREVVHEAKVSVLKRGDVCD